MTNKTLYISLAWRVTVFLGVTILLTHVAKQAFLCSSSFVSPGKVNLGGIDKMPFQVKNNIKEYGVYLAQKILIFTIPFCDCDSQVQYTRITLVSSSYGCR